MRLQVFERRFGDSCAAELDERMREVGGWSEGGSGGRIEGQQHTITLAKPVLRL